MREALGLGQVGERVGETGERDEMRGSTLLDRLGRVRHGVGIGVGIMVWKG